MSDAQANAAFDNYAKASGGANTLGGVAYAGVSAGLAQDANYGSAANWFGLNSKETLDATAARTEQARREAEEASRRAGELQSPLLTRVAEFFKASQDGANKPPSTLGGLTRAVLGIPEDAPATNLPQQAISSLKDLLPSAQDFLGSSKGVKKIGNLLSGAGSAAMDLLEMTSAQSAAAGADKPGGESGKTLAVTLTGGNITLNKDGTFDINASGAAQDGLAVAGG